jgi:hypothetical protein
MTTLGGTGNPAASFFAPGSRVLMPKEDLWIHLEATKRNARRLPGAPSNLEELP